MAKAKAKPKATAKEDAIGSSKANHAGKHHSSFWTAVFVGAVLALTAAYWLRPRSAREGNLSDTATTPSPPVVDKEERPNPNSAIDASKSQKTAKTKSKKKEKVEEEGGPYKWDPKTLSVVLPCAGEGLFAKKTVMSVAKSVPGGIGGGILEDIVVVDDGSQPALNQEFLTDAFREKYSIKLVRHEKAVGLMGAKSAGAAKAAGDVIVFFDCHVAPQDDWYRKFLDSIAMNYRRIVVPVITNLDIDTWKEVNRNQGFAKCYLTWDADFKWVDSTSAFMPVLSGGLLGISRRWWNETGGYDDGMSGWGGENVDQSLRSWLCGGEIVSLPNAYVAHMWRKTEDPRTKQNYEVTQLDSVKNKARAVLAWYDEFREKAAEYPLMSYVGLLENQAAQTSQQVSLNRDVSNFEEVKQRLQCRPFAWFLWRFRDIYVDGGLLPTEVFKLREVKSGNCLTYIGPMGTHPTGSGQAAVMPCNAALGSMRGMHPEAQRWQMRNRNPKTGKCCSALGSWNTDQCVTNVNQEGMLQTHVCDVSGKQSAPWFLTAPDDKGGPGPGQVVFSVHGRVRCLVIDKKAGPLQLGASLQASKVKLVDCGKAAKNGPRWEKLEASVPLETRLYQEALESRPEIFVA
mmetsp:Transcript_58838/g.137831  ORF Transcript_58838/g.137831 Transcript_58838/m.137831 type:complete len:627 (-) Transcript_58838:128-2008(-)